MNYSILDPTGNITAIITTPVDPDKRASAAAQVMETEPDVEQVGFLTGGNGIYDGFLQMAGGEFCGNASLSAAAIIAMDRKVKVGDTERILLKVSGSKGLVPVQLEAISENSFKGRVLMPEAKGMAEVFISEEDKMKAPVVIMPGIAHAIVPESFGAEKAEAVLPDLCQKIGADAMGIMLIDDAKSRITPIVYVPSAGTLVRENSCASGTAAVGAYLAASEGNRIERSFTEPGGILTVEAEPGGDIIIGGTVSLLKKF